MLNVKLLMILLFSKIYKNIKKIAKKKKLEYNFIMVHFIKEKYQEIICMDMENLNSKSLAMKVLGVLIKCMG